MSKHDYSTLSKEQLIEVLQRRDSQSSYGLHWERNNIDPERALNRDFVGLQLVPEHSCGEGPWENLVIEGDNYDALRHLATTQAGQYKLIYIDVPYNTGNKDFVYNDNFFDARNRYRHSTWLEFIYQRLVLARSLLSEDGAIVVSIDDNEIFNLGMLMNQVFGERSFVATCVWQKRYSRENRSAIGDAHEYLLVYSPNPALFKVRRGLVPLNEEQAKVYRNPDNKNETDPAKRWRSIPLTAQGYRANQMYRVYSPKGTPHDPPEGRCWSLLEADFLELDAKGKIYWGKDGTAQPGLIRYLNEVEGLVPHTWWPHDEVGHTDEARKEIQDIFGTQTAFDTPKPLRLMERVLEIFAPEKDARVLDFFAGSGTLGHAVLKRNLEDGGSRRFVMVSNRESTPENPDKNLCRDICAVRLRKAVEGYTSEKQGAVAALGGSFGYMRAVPVAMHRLEEGLSDSMVWTFALQACGHPISKVESGLSVSIRGNHAVAYCANTKAATIDALKATAATHKGPLVVLTWAPQAVQESLGGLDANVSYVSVPQDLQKAFRQGNARVGTAPDLETEALPPEEVEGDDVSRPIVEEAEDNQSEEGAA